ncbi:MAG: HD domain-containing phosphohydrolase [Pseudomonadota bacterium]
MDIGRFNGFIKRNIDLVSFAALKSGVHKFNRFIKRNSEHVFLVCIFLFLLIVTFFVRFLANKFAIINLYFIPVIIAAHYWNVKNSILGAVICILTVSTGAVFYPKEFLIVGSFDTLILYIISWGIILILVAFVISEHQNKLKQKIKKEESLNEQLLKAYKNSHDTRAVTILGLAKLSEYRDEDTGKHLERIRECARLITRELAMHPKYKGYITDDYVEDVYLSCILHDVGKVGVPDAILLKPGKLTPDEITVIRQHCKLGGDALKDVEANIPGTGRSFLALAKEIAYHHHEKWDGTGYPQGLKGEQIPLSARIVALVDVYDALTSKRVYKDAYPHEKAVEIIKNDRGKHFDPDIIDIFISQQQEFKRIRSQLREDQV